MTALRLPSDLIPPIVAATALAAALAFRRLPLADDREPLRWFEAALIGGAALLELLRLVPYAAQLLTGRLAAAVHHDDNWHFQELASLVTSDRFPPLVNFQPDTHLHFYYVAWMPAAAIATVFELAGVSAVKLSFGIGALLLGLAAAVILIVVLRHLLPPEKRGAALAALMLAGAVPDGVAVLVGWAAALAGHGPAEWLAESEWWQLGFGIPNQISTLTTLLIWVPHHLIGAMAMLLAVVVSTEPITLRPRASLAAMAAAGLLVGFAAFSSIFAVLGGLAALSPLLVRLLARPQVVVALAATALVSAPLAYLYLNADSAGGFRLLLIFTRWSELYGGPAAGLAGLSLAALFVMVEIGWLAWLALRPPPSPVASPLGQCAVAATVFVASTVVVGFSGANNYAMRGAIVPVVLIAAYWAQVRTGDAAPRRLPAAAVVALGLAVTLAVVAHLAETLRHGRDSLAAITLADETEACKASIMAANAGPPGRVDPDGFGCRNPYSLYGLERPFVKRRLEEPDRELMGRGP
ncbi:hypothetical protein CCR97_21855 [Rhodoplanes elegans]|nr:hypothetical protein [Rhodoplanes elegans]